MNRDTKIWLAVFLIGAALLGLRAILAGGLFGTAYVREDVKVFVPVAAADLGPNVTADDRAKLRWVLVSGIGQKIESGKLRPDFTADAFGDDERISWSEYADATRVDFDAQPAGAAVTGDGAVTLSLPRTLGIWVAALFTLFVLSFVIGDNPFYKVAESVFIGISAAYWMVVAFWDTLIPNLVGKLSPELMRNWAMPGLSIDAAIDWVYLVPLALGVMLLWRLSPVGGWISRWPMAFFIGTFCGLRLIRFLHADFLSQIRNSIVPLVAEKAQIAADGTPILDAVTGLPVMAFSPGNSFLNLILIIGILACLVYFFFSIEHKGAVGGTARVGIWFLMITFGAAFGYTVMGRIALLAIRIEFLFDDWLWLIDPTGRRMADAAAMLGLW